MAELLLKIGPGSNYDDGDILCAFNRHRIRCCHAWMICHFRRAKRNGSGLILPTEPARDWFEATHQYRFERVSARELKRVNLADFSFDIISDRPNEKGQAIDVRLFVRRRKQRDHHYLFGEDGAEIWYGGRKDFSHRALDKVWAAIEAKTEHRETNFSRWPMGRLDIRHHLPIAVDDFDDAVAGELVAPEMDETDPENPVRVQKRKHAVDWRARLGLNAADIAKVQVREQVMDLRDRGEFQRAAIVRQKPSKRTR